jgi:hypothetical protein
MRIAFYWCTPLDGNNLCKRKWRLINLNFEQSKWIVKCCSKTENVTEVQRRWKNEFGTPPTRVTVTKIRDKFEVDGTVQNVSKGLYGSPRSSAHDESVATVL